MSQTFTDLDAARLIRRVDVFSDSSYLAGALLEIAEASGGYGYYEREAAEHITGLYGLAKELTEALKERV